VHDELKEADASAAQSTNDDVRAADANAAQSVHDELKEADASAAQSTHEDAPAAEASAAHSVHEDVPAAEASAAQSVQEDVTKAHEGAAHASEVILAESEASMGGKPDATLEQETQTPGVTLAESSHTQEAAPAPDAPAAAAPMQTDAVAPTHGSETFLVKATKTDALDGADVLSASECIVPTAETDHAYAYVVIDRHGWLCELDRDAETRVPSAVLSGASEAYVCRPTLVKRFRSEHIEHNDDGTPAVRTVRGLQLERDTDFADRVFVLRRSRRTGAYRMIEIGTDGGDGAKRCVVSHAKAESVTFADTLGDVEQKLHWRATRDGDDVYWTAAWRS